MSDLGIRALGPGDTEAVLELLRIGLGEGTVPRTPEFWHWKHDRNPFGRSFALLAESRGRPVGLRMFLRWSFRSGGQCRVAVRAVDTVTHPEWRGRGLFSRLTRELLEVVEKAGVALVFNTPNRKSRPGYLKMGWRDAGRVPLMVRVRNPLRLLVGSGGAPVTELSAFPQVEELLAPQTCAGWAEEHRGDERLSTVRSPAYLRWRYGDIPGIEYRCLQARRRGDRAALVFRERRRRGRVEVDVAEVLTGGSAGGIDLAAGLLRRLVGRCRASGLAAVATPGSPERRALRRAGFLPARWLAPRLTVLPLAGRTSDSGRDSAFTADAWRWSLGDLEIF